MKMEEILKKLGWSTELIKDFKNGTIKIKTPQSEPSLNIPDFTSDFSDSNELFDLEEEPAGINKFSYFEEE